MAKTSSLLSPSFLPCYGKLETPREPNHRAILARPQPPHHPRSAPAGAPIQPRPPSRRRSGSGRARRCSSGRPHPCSLRWPCPAGPSARRHAAAPPPPAEGAGGRDPLCAPPPVSALPRARGRLPAAASQPRRWPRREQGKILPLAVKGAGEGLHCTAALFPPHPCARPPCMPARDEPPPCIFGCRFRHGRAAEQGKKGPSDLPRLREGELSRRPGPAIGYSRHTSMLGSSSRRHGGSSIPPPPWGKLCPATAWGAGVGRETHRAEEES
jgi:hypothetical protein